ncbi:MAG: hypothetical protein MUE47_06355 [Acidobacteria bacterium]|jgi:hypothetical protein|nr:hypothetical protein [Acidobacteriota bacterium]
MKSVAYVLVFLAVASALWATAAAVAMTGWLSHHGVKVNWPLLRLYMPWYVHRYQRMTREIDGRAGPLFAHFVVPINLALLFAVAALIVIVASR